MNNCRLVPPLHVRSRGWLACLGSLVLIILVHSAPAIPGAESARLSVKQLVEFHQQHHPQLKAQDVFKFFYQAAFGVEHILSDSSEVASYLTRELASLDTVTNDEPLFEQISLDGDVVRVNLRQFKALNLDPSLLVKVMFQSARETIPDTAVFNRMWNEFSSLVRFGFLKFSPDDVKDWDTRIESGNIPAVHHSREYSETNKPAYRVVRRSIFEEAFGKIKE